jgi:hypothetical protein
MPGSAINCPMTPEDSGYWSRGPIGKTSKRFEKAEMHRCPSMSHK